MDFNTEGISKWARAVVIHIIKYGISKTTSTHKISTHKITKEVRFCLKNVKHIAK